MWIIMKAIGKSIITGRYADSLTRQAGLRRDGASECSPLGGLSVEYISLSWADVMSCAASCALQILSYIWAFQISMYYLIVSVAHHGEQDGPNPALRAAGEKGLEGDCWGNHCGGHRGDRP